MSNIPSRSPYPGQFITLCFDQLRPHKLSSTFCSFTPCSPLLSFVLSNEATVDQSLSFLQRHRRRLGVILIALLTPVYCARTHGFGTYCPRPVTLMSVSSAGWQLHRLAARLVTLHSVSSPCSQYRHFAVSLLALLLAALKSVSRPCSRSRRLAVSLLALLSASSPCVGRIEICLTALQSVSSPYNQYHHLAVVNIVPNINAS